MSSGRRRRAMRAKVEPLVADRKQRAEMARIKAESENRMKVFDAAPARVRRACWEKGDKPLKVWWARLKFASQERILFDTMVTYGD